MIRTMLHNTKTGETRWGDEGLLAEWYANPDLWIWADFDNADPEHEMKLFVHTFKRSICIHWQFLAQSENATRQNW